MPAQDAADLTGAERLVPADDDPGYLSHGLIGLVGVALARVREGGDLARLWQRQPDV